MSHECSHTVSVSVSVLFYHLTSEYMARGGHVDMVCLWASTYWTGLDSYVASRPHRYSFGLFLRI